MKKSNSLLVAIIIFTLSIIFPSISSAQTPAKYWIAFKDKAHSTFSIGHPEEYLSQQALNKRHHFHIAITEEDLPVNQNYIDSILQLDTSNLLLTKSKWLNGITIYTTDSLFENKAKRFDFVTFIDKTISLKEQEVFKTDTQRLYKEIKFPENIDKSKKETSEYNFTKTFPIANLNHSQWLYRMGYTGKGMVMMVMDEGFKNVDSIKAFKRLRNEGRILGAKNFYHQEECIFRNGNHGEMVLSCIAAYKKGSFIGTAPDAYFYLAKTEDGQSENIIEEDNWVAGIEWADSLGVDVLNSSLGYTQFDDDTMGHPRTIEMLNGQTSRASKAATLAVQRGMIVCNSAGNSGAKSWHRIGTPADAKDILTVGATFINGNHANFSSFGPTSDGRVKPDACAAGAFVPVFKTDGKIGNASGTSFASPYLAGMTASLWQAFPEKSNYEIMDAIRKSGSQYNQPDSTLGYGVTDFMKAYNILYDNDLIETQVILQDYVIPYDKKYRYTLHINIYSAHKQSVTLKAQSRISGTEIILTQTIPAGKKKINLPLGKATSQYDIADLEIQTENGTRKFVIGLEEIKKEGE